MHPDVSNFIMQVLQGKDMIDELNKGFHGSGTYRNTTEFTMLELAEKVIKLTYSKSKIAFEPLPQDNLRQRKPDITLAKKELQWKLKIALEEGLKK